MCSFPSLNYFTSNYNAMVLAPRRSQYFLGKENGEQSLILHWRTEFRSLNTLMQLIFRVGGIAPQAYVCITEKIIYPKGPASSMLLYFTRLGEGERMETVIFDRATLPLSGDSWKCSIEVFTALQ